MKHRKWLWISLGGLGLLVLGAVVLSCMEPPRAVRNEAYAVASIRTITNAEEEYRRTYGGYANSLSELGGERPCVPSQTTACFIDQVLSCGNKSGYMFVAAGSDPVKGKNTKYLVSAVPRSLNNTGKRVFCATEDGVIRSDASPASTTPPNARQCAAFGALN